MATVYPTASGAWSTRTWNNDADGSAYGMAPQVGDTVLANAQTITLDGDITVVAISNLAGTTAAAGGQFQNSGAYTVNANVVGGGGFSYALLLSGGSAKAVNGNISGGCDNSGGGTVTVTGNIIGGASASYHGFRQRSGGSLIVNGNVTGGSGGSVVGIDTDNGGSITINGNLTSGSAGGTNGIALTNSTYTVTVNGTITATATSPAIVSINTDTKLIHDGTLVAASDGTPPISIRGKYLIHASNTQEHKYRVNNSGSAGAERTLTTATGSGGAAQLINGGLVR